MDTNLDRLHVLAVSGMGLRRVRGMPASSPSDRPPCPRLRCFCLPLLGLWLLCRHVEGLEFVTEPSGGVATPGGSFWFHCQAEDGAHVVTYLWRFGDADIISTEESEPSNDVIYTNGTLLIKEVKKENEGQYMCVASAGGHSIYSRDASLRMAYIADAFKTNPQNVTVTVGQPLLLRCDIDSLPAPQFTWRLNGLDLAPSVTLNPGSVDLSPASFEDGGEYVCAARNGVLNVTRLSSSGHVTVVGPPVMLTAAQTVTVPVGYPAILDCAVLAHPPATLSWLRLSAHDNESSLPLPVQVSNRVEILPNHTLLIRNATPADSAIYRCVAVNEYGETTLSVVVDVSGQPSPPTILHLPSDQTLNSGDTLVLNCSATGNPAPLIIWTKGTSEEALTTGASFQVDAVRATDAGQYRCVASNSEGTDTKTTSVTVLYGPEFLKRPENQTVLAGDTARLPCQAAGEPPPRLQWTTPRSVVLPASHQTGQYAVDGAGTLTIQPVAAEDGGSYTCIASSARGSLAAVVWLTVTGPPYFLARPQSRVALQGETTTFSCQLAGYPVPEVTWFRGGQEQPLSPDSKAVLSPDGALTLVAVGLGDDGTYRCVGNNSLGSVQAFAVLTVHVPPTFTVAPASQSVVVGQTVTLSCMVSGVPVPSQRWVWGGETLSLDDNMSVDQNHTLTITDIRRQQLGQYTCMAHNQAGQRVATASLHFSGQPYFTLQPFNVTANVTEPLTLSCRASQASADVTLTPALHWYRGLRDGATDILIHTIDRAHHDQDGDGEERAGGEEEGVEGGDGGGDGARRFWATSQGDLVFVQVLEDDRGWYYCNAANREAVIYADPIYIRVQVPPTIRTISNPPPTASQAAVNITCHAEGDPDPEVTWRSPEGQEIKVSVEGYRLVDEVLMIGAATNEKDGGSWVCVACNLLGCDSADTFLGVEGKPVIREIQADQNSSTGHIFCVTAGLPAPAVTFSSEDSDVSGSPDHHVTGGHVYIHRAGVKDEYTCTAKNVHGNASVTMTAPQAPQLLGAIPSSRTVTLSISAAGRLGVLPLEGVVVVYRKADSSEWLSKYITTKLSANDERPQTDFIREWEHVDSEVSGNSEATGDMEVTVTGLVPHSVYWMRVRLVNVLGEGPLSGNSVRVLTLPGAPPPPDDVTVTSENRRIVVLWRIPQHLNGNKDNILFKVLVSNSSGVVVSQSSLPADQDPKVVVSDLELGNHSVTMTTVNSRLHLSSAAVTRFILVTQAVPVFVPTVLNVTVINDTALVVTWKTPTSEPTDPEEPPVRGYLVRLQSAALQTPLTERVSGRAEHTHVQAGLQERTRYRCSVAAFNEGGSGHFSDPVDAVTFYSLFSSLATKDAATELALSGLWIAVLGGCLGGAVLVVIVVCLARRWRTLRQGSRLDLMQTSHGLDPFYLENPKGLHNSTRNTVQWRKVFLGHRLFTALETNNNNNNANNNNCINHSDSDTNNGVHRSGNDNSMINDNTTADTRHSGSRSAFDGDNSANNSNCDRVISPGQRTDSNPTPCKNGRSGGNCNTAAVDDTRGSDHKPKDNTNNTNNNSNSNSSANNGSRVDSHTTNITNTGMTTSSSTIVSKDNSNDADGRDSNPGWEKMETTVVDPVGTDRTAPGGGQRQTGGGGQESSHRRWWNRLRLPLSVTAISSLTSVFKNPSKVRAGRAKWVISHPHFSGQGATIVHSCSSVTNDVAAPAAAAAATGASSPSPMTVNRPHLHQHISPSRRFALRFSLDDDVEGFPDGVSLSSASGSVVCESGVPDQVYAEIETRPAKDGGVGDDDVPRKGVTMILGRSRAERQRDGHKELGLVAPYPADSVGADADTERRGTSCRRPAGDPGGFNKEKSVTFADGVTGSHTPKRLKMDRCRVYSNKHASRRTSGEEGASHYGKNTSVDPQDRSSARRGCHDDGSCTTGRRGGDRQSHPQKGGGGEGQRATHEVNTGPTSSLRPAAHPLTLPTEDDSPYTRDSPVYAALGDCDVGSEASIDDGNPPLGGDGVLHWLDSDLQVGDRQEMFCHHAPLGYQARETRGSGAVTLSDGETIMHVPQDQKKDSDDSCEGASSLQDQMFQNNCTDDVNAFLARENLHHHTADTHTEHNQNADDGERSSTGDRSTTVTDGESVYHILHRLDQDLEEHMVTETLESSVDVISLSASSVEEPSGGLYTDLDQPFDRSIHVQIFNSNEPSVDTNFERLNPEVSPFQLVSQKKDSSADTSRDTYQPSLDISPQGGKDVPKVSESIFTKSKRSSTASRKASVDVQRLSMVLSNPAADPEWPANRTDPDEDFSVFSRSDDGNVSSPAQCRFNSELHSYEVNPLRSSTTDTTEPINLYAEGSARKGLNSDLAVQPRPYSPPASRRRPLGHSTHSRGNSVGRGASTQYLFTVDSEDEKVVRELVDTLDSLGRPGNAVVMASRPKFYSVQRRKPPGRQRSETSPPTVFTMQSSQPATPRMKSGGSLNGSIRSRAAAPISPSQRRFSVDMALPTGLTKVAWPGNRGKHVTAASSANGRASPWSRAIPSSAARSGTWRKKSESSGRAVRNRHRDSRQGKQSWWESLFQRQDGKPTHESPGVVASTVSWRDSESGANHGRARGVASGSAVAATPLEARSAADDVVFGVNNVGFETASLF